MKANFDSSHEISRNRQDLSTKNNAQDHEFDKNNLTTPDSITVNKDPATN